MTSTNLTMRINQANVNHLDSMRSATLVSTKRLFVKEKSKVSSAPIVRGSVATKTLLVAPPFTFSVAELSNRLLNIVGAVGAGNGVLPTAALLCVGRNKGDSFSCVVFNTNMGGNLTIVGGTGVTVAGVATIANDTASELVFTIVENATGSEAVSVLILE